MRDRLIHDYIDVNYTIVWDVLKNKIPDTHKQISEFLDENKNQLSRYKRFGHLTEFKNGFVFEKL